MKRLVLIFVGVIMLSAWGLAQESKREKRASRTRTQTELIRTLFESRDLRFVAQIAQPLSGGTIHLTSPYTLDLIGDSVASHLPFYGVAYSVDYGGGNGGFMFDKQLADVKWETSKHGYEVTAEVRVPRDVYKMHLSLSTAGYATLSVISQNRQAMHFTGVISKREESR